MMPIRRPQLTQSLSSSPTRRGSYEFVLHVRIPARRSRNLYSAELNEYEYDAATRNELKTVVRSYPLDRTTSRSEYSYRLRVPVRIVGRRALSKIKSSCAGGNLSSQRQVSARR
eukprot:scaffold281036_cov34-Prasinocladus_malaysianus.AAC.1